MSDPIKFDPLQFEIDGVIVEAMDIASTDEDEIGIWIPCSKSFKDVLDGSFCDVVITIRED